MPSLAALPPSILPLSNVESEWLEGQHDNLVSSPAQCLTCGGQRTFRWFDYDEKRQRTNDVVEYTCPCAEQWILNRYLLLRGIGAYWQRLEWADATGVPVDAMEKMQTYLSKHAAYINAGIGFVFYGDQRGTGKTLSSVLMSKQLIRLGYDTHWTMFHELVTALMRGWKDKEAQRWFEARVRNVDVLAIDDIGRENSGLRGSSDTARFAIEDIIRHRTNNAKPTIITTNLDINKMESFYGSHLISLLSERAVTSRFQSEGWRSTASTRNHDEIDLGVARPVMLGCAV